METEQEAQEDVPEEGVHEESSQPEQEIEQEESIAAEESTETKQEESAEQKNLRLSNQGEDRSPFIHGLAVGLGIGCIATFVIVWISVFFTPKLSSGITYENLLSIFIYPLIYLLAVGLIALTAGIVREYYAIRNRL